MTLAIGKAKRFHKPTSLLVWGFGAILSLVVAWSGEARAAIDPEKEALTDPQAQREIARSGWGHQLGARLSLRPVVLDYELPGHPLELGRGHNGALVSGELWWKFDRYLSISAGVLGRLPFALDFHEEAAAFPLFSILVHPFPEHDVQICFGTLNIRHGFHRAVVDEARYSYGRNYEETYNRSLRPEGRRDLGQQLAMPVETGAQLLARYGGFSAELYLDWQLLETDDHREKFAVGLLTGYSSRYFDGGFQLRLVHYGGQLFTAQDPIRQMGLDPKRQPLTLALLATPKPLQLDYLTISLPIAYLEARVIQEPGGEALAHRGLELGLDVTLFKMLTVGYRFWLPGLGSGFEAAYLSEDSDPVYSGPQSHRPWIGLVAQYGLVSLNGRLDLIFPKGSQDVQYQTITTLSFDWEPLIWERKP